MSDDKPIFGYSWDTIQAMQQGTYKRPVIDTSKPATVDAPTARDVELLAEHGAEGLAALQFHGTIYRLQMAGLIPVQEI